MMERLKNNAVTAVSMWLKSKCYFNEFNLSDRQKLYT